MDRSQIVLEKMIQADALLSDIKLSGEDLISMAKARIILRDIYDTLIKNQNGINKEE